VEYEYDIQGEQRQMKDQNQTVHNYIFDQLGRETEDEVTFPTGSNIDQTVNRIQQGYDQLGNLNDIVSYGPSSSSNQLNFNSGDVLAPSSSTGNTM
jgi:hypothetical protein